LGKKSEGRPQKTEEDKMDDTKVLVIPAGLARQIEGEGARAYPNECCGIMIGRDEGRRRYVERLEPVANEFEEGERYHRFLITPADLMRAEKAAGGRLVLGFYHSHPDHPARPSEYDREHAWPFYSYVIVAIAKGEATDMTSWVLDEVTETFKRQDIVEE
jgi:proteasome lid subunit RPN8/RPN11